MAPPPHRAAGGAGKAAVIPTSDRFAKIRATAVVTGAKAARQATVATRRTPNQNLGTAPVAAARRAGIASGMRAGRGRGAARASAVAPIRPTAKALAVVRARRGLRTTRDGRIVASGRVAVPVVVRGGGGRGRARGRGRGRGRGGPVVGANKPKPKPITQADLDAEMDAYMKDA